MSTIDTINQLCNHSPMKEAIQNAKSLSRIMPLMSHLMCHVRQQTSQIYSALGYELTPEAADALMIIHHFDGLPQKKLADILGKDKASITRLLNTLVKINLVERIQDENDRRVIRAHITKEGTTAFHEFYPKIKVLSEQILHVASDDDFEKMVVTLSQIVHGLPCHTPESIKT